MGECSVVFQYPVQLIYLPMFNFPLPSGCLRHEWTATASCFHSPLFSPLRYTPLPTVPLPSCKAQEMRTLHAYPRSLRARAWDGVVSPCRSALAWAVQLARFGPQMHRAPSSTRGCGTAPPVYRDLRLSIRCRAAPSSLGAGCACWGDGLDDGFTAAQSVSARRWMAHV